MSRQGKRNESLYQNVLCAIGKNSRFIKEQEASGLISSLLGLNTPTEGISILGSII